jgi:hypothetical protein
LAPQFPWRSGRFAPFQARTHQGCFGHEHNRTIVITVETQPNFTSGAAAWTPDEVHNWFKLPQVSRYWVVAFANPGSRMVRRQQRPHFKDQLLVSMITRESRRVGSGVTMNWCSP